MKKIVLLVAVCAMLFSVVCFAASSGSITMAGSTSVQPLAEELAQAYMAKYPDVKIAVQGGGSGAGIKAAMDGTADIGMCSRELNPDETGIVDTEIAKDGVVMIVNKVNNLTNLTLDQLQKIYTGTYKTWKQVAGPKGLNTKIVVVNREAGSGTRGAFEDLVLGKLKNTSNCLVQSSTGAVQQTVAVTKEAVGYISLGSLDPSAVKALSLNGVVCNVKNIVAQKYLIQRPFLLLTKTAPTGLVKDFYAWILGPEGQKIVAKDYISINEK
jgi:phosphate transport system substrate-binding protein